MKTISNTKNQHFVSQWEQRLNAANPNAEAKNHRVSRSEPIDREQFNLKSPAEVKVARNLAFLDLFTFDVKSKTLRHNLEHQFGEIERRGASACESILAQLKSPTESIGTHLRHLFVAKLTNFLRNPYCVTKALNTFGAAGQFRPTDPELRALYDRIRTGSRPQGKRVAYHFGLSTADYDWWLRSLFMLVSNLGLFEETVNELLLRSYTSIQVHHFSSPDPQHVVLLSDRGFNSSVNDDRWFEFEFNVSSRVFVQLRATSPEHFATPGLPSECIDACRGQMQIALHTDELSQLIAYNRRTLYQCAEAVFSASPNPVT